MHDLIGANLTPGAVTQGVEGHVEGAAAPLWMPELLDKCKFLAAQRARPGSPHMVPLVWHLVKGFEHRGADGRADAVESLKGVGGRPVYGQPSQFEIRDEDHGCHIFDDIRQQLALRQSRRNALLKRFVQVPQFLLGFLASAYIDRGADHADAAVAIKDASSLRRYPADDAVFLPDRPIFNVIDGPYRRVGRRRKGGGGGFVILGVKTGVKIGDRDRHIGGNSEHRLDPWRPEESSPDLVHIP